MRRWFNNLVAKIQKLSKNRSASRPQRRVRLGLEALEQRDLMSATPLLWTAPSGNLSNNISLSVVSGYTPVTAANQAAYQANLTAYQAALTAYEAALKGYGKRVNAGYEGPAPIAPIAPIAPTPQPFTNVEVMDNGQLVASQSVASTSAVTLTGAANSTNTFDILSTLAGIPTMVNLGSGGDSVVVGANNSAASIQGALSIQGFQGQGSVTLNDSAFTGFAVKGGIGPGSDWADGGFNATIGRSSITGLSPAAIN